MTNQFPQNTPPSFIIEQMDAHNREQMYAQTLEISDQASSQFQDIYEPTPVRPPRNIREPMDIIEKMYAQNIREPMYPRTIYSTNETTSRSNVGSSQYPRPSYPSYPAINNYMQGTKFLSMS
jgi:hypothetical protein